MVRFKKFLLIPVLVLVYLSFIESITSGNFFAGSQGPSGSGGGMVAIGMGHGIGVTVMRQYFFGLITLPVYSASLGNIGGLHTAFFYFVAALTLAFVIMEKRQKKVDVKNKPPFRF